MSSHLAIEGPLFRDKPHAWLQWKGTDVCVDLHCECGAHLHYDGAFLYYWRCPHCKRIWEMGTHISIYEVPADKQMELEARGSVKTPEPDEDAGSETKQ